MCIIAVKPADKVIKESILRECFFRNPDGAGISYVQDGRIVINKGIKSADALVAAVNEVMDKEVVIHCRIASRGMVVNEANCHPFYIKARVNKDTGEADYEYSISHNGTLEWGHTNDKSDTCMFTEQFLTPMFESHPHILTWEWGRIALERTLSFGTGLKGRLNKMVIMVNDRRGEGRVLTYILNEFEGNWNGGIWYSNYSWDENTRPVKEYKGYEDFFGHKAGGTIKGSPKSGNNYAAEQFRWYSEPDANGWFWSYTWDAWINHKTGCILRVHSHRQAPEYTRKPGFIPQDLGGRSTLSKGEVNHMLLTIYEAFELGSSPPEGKYHQLQIMGGETIDKLAHLEPHEKSLLCKKAYDIILWAGESKKTAKGMNAEEKIKELRYWVRAMFNGQPEGFEVEGMTDIELDAWTVKKIKDGELTLEKLNDLYVAQDKKAETIGGSN